MSSPGPLVETSWLAERLGEEGPVVLDASHRMPGQGRARDAFEARRIPGAIFFDIESISDRASDLPHMLPSAEDFAAMVGALGIGAQDRIVVYDDAGLFSAARAWWMFRAMGFDAVSVLNGGLPRWLAEGRPVEAGAPSPRAPKRFSVSRRPALATDASGVRRALSTPGALVLDARPSGRFEGRDPEPRPGLRKGRMPGAASLPHSELLAGGALKPAAELRALLEARGWTPDAEVVATCGSGITACVVALALNSIGAPDAAVYDGSWAEWGRSDNDPHLFPVATGA